MHETGAVEATGHKVLPCAAKDGKVTAEGVEAVCALHTDEHMVAPRLLYVSQPTEIGTVYHLDEDVYKRQRFLRSAAHPPRSRASETLRPATPGTASMQKFFFYFSYRHAPFADLFCHLSIESRIYFP